MDAKARNGIYVVRVPKNKIKKKRTNKIGEVLIVLRDHLMNKVIK